jgi:hypothetical protein
MMSRISGVRCYTRWGLNLEPTHCAAATFRQSSTKSSYFGLSSISDWRKRRREKKDAEGRQGQAQEEDELLKQEEAQMKEKQLVSRVLGSITIFCEKWRFSQTIKVLHNLFKKRRFLPIFLAKIF